ncbi:hypothetical protein AaE_011671 [Aphanomyces astaci]|uniref:Tc1-like transposase DDE domain-containing protein n=1 Tax=Aphanomyces astaci TaxID=112090 RepID=A0A6A4ZCE7_APHAT|nr:hypothetical protein AaE_011671 [Aphanomyces astaci]
MRWRSIVLRYVYGLDIKDIHAVLGMSIRSITRWNQQFQRIGHVGTKTREKRSSRWSPDVIQFVKQYTTLHPCFYIEELQAELKFHFPVLQNTSTSTICRALRFDLHLTRKVLEKQARESSAHEVQMYRSRLEPFYSHPSQLVFVDETSKDGRDALRKYAWSRRNTPAVVSLPFARGQRVSILAAFDSTGFISWDYTAGTFDRNRFHQVMSEQVIPYLNPWPLPRSILILDNAKIHMYRELEAAVHARGALVFFLPPYCPQLKRWILKYPLAFRNDIRRTLEVALVKSTISTESPSQMGLNLCHHCGYENGYLDDDKFNF